MIARFMASVAVLTLALAACRVGSRVRHSNASPRRAHGHRNRPNRGDPYRREKSRLRNALPDHHLARKSQGRGPAMVARKAIRAPGTSRLPEWRPTVRGECESDQRQGRFRDGGQRPSVSHPVRGIPWRERGREEGPALARRDGQARRYHFRQYHLRATDRRARDRSPLPRDSACSRSRASTKPER